MRRLVFFTSESHSFLEEQSVLSLTLVGSLAAETSPVFERCAKQILEADSKWVILNFRDVTGDMDPQFVPILEVLFKAIRTRGGVRISGLHPGSARRSWRKGSCARTSLPTTCRKPSKG